MLRPWRDFIFILRANDYSSLSVILQAQKHYENSLRAWLFFSIYLFFASQIRVNQVSD